MSKVIMEEYKWKGRKWFAYYRQKWVPVCGLELEGLETTNFKNKDFRCAGYGLSRYGEEEWRSDIEEVDTLEDMRKLVEVLKKEGKYEGQHELCDCI